MSCNNGKSGRVRNAAEYVTVRSKREVSRVHRGNSAGLVSPNGIEHQPAPAGGGCGAAVPVLRGGGGYHLAAFCFDCIFSRSRGGISGAPARPSYDRRA